VSVGKLIYDKLLTHCVEDEAMVSFIMFSDQLYSLTCSLSWLSPDVFPPILNLNFK
jgi:hypothetical protein